jgi:amidase
VSPAPKLGEAWAGFSTDGALTRSVRDAAALLDVMGGYEVGDPYTAPPAIGMFRSQLDEDPGRLHIGILDHPILDGSDGHPDVRRAVAAAADLLEGLGHRVETSHPAALSDPEMARRYLDIVATGTAVEIAEWEAMAGRSFGEADLEPSNLALVDIARGVTASRYVESVQWLHRWTRRVVAWWDDVDVLVTPVIAKPPPPLGYIRDGDTLREYFQYTAWFNVTGQPAISLPLEWSDEGLPIGVQFVAAPWREDLLIRLAAQLEQAKPWSSRRSVVHA